MAIMAMPLQRAAGFCPQLDSVCSACVPTRAKSKFRGQIAFITINRESAGGDTRATNYNAPLNAWSSACVIGGYQRNLGTGRLNSRGWGRSRYRWRRGGGERGQEWADGMLGRAAPGHGRRLFGPTKHRPRPHRASQRSGHGAQGCGVSASRAGLCKQRGTGILRVKS